MGVTEPTDEEMPWYPEGFDHPDQASALSDAELRQAAGAALYRNVWSPLARAVFAEVAARFAALSVVPSAPTEDEYRMLADKIIERLPVEDDDVAEVSLLMDAIDRAGDRLGAPTQDDREALIDWALIRRVEKLDSVLSYDEIHAITTAPQYGNPRPNSGEGTITWSEHLQAWATYHRLHPEQSAERIAERGGFGFGELVALLGHAPTTFRPSSEETGQ